MLKGYFDASGKGAKDIFVLAGYISTADRWAQFSDAWDVELKGGNDKKRRQPIKVFKLRNMNLDSTNQLNRCAILNRIIHEHAIARVACVVDVAALDRILKNSWWTPFIDKDREPPDSAYWYGFRLVNEVFHFLRRDHPELGLTGPIDFIFDQENESDKAGLVSAWEFFYKTCSPEKREIVGNIPSFARDDIVLPLQAADLLAGLSRRIAASGQSIKGLRTPWSSECRNPIQTVTLEHHEADIRRNLDRVMGNQFVRQVWKLFS